MKYSIRSVQTFYECSAGNSAQAAFTFAQSLRVLAFLFSVTSTNLLMLNAESTPERADRIEKVEENLLVPRSRELWPFQRGCLRQQRDSGCCMHRWRSAKFDETL